MECLVYMNRSHNSNQIWNQASFSMKEIWNTYEFSEKEEDDVFSCLNEPFFSNKMDERSSMQTSTLVLQLAFYLIIVPLKSKSSFCLYDFLIMHFCFVLRVCWCLVSIAYLVVMSSNQVILIRTTCVDCTVLLNLWSL